MYKMLLSWFFLSVLFSCSNKPANSESKNIKEIADSSNTTKNVMPPLKEGITDIEENAFGKTIELEGKAFDLQQIFRPSEVEMIVKDDYLVLKTLQNKDMFMVFSLPELKLVHKFGIHGGGPNEFNSPYLVSTPEQDKICYIYDANWQKLYYLKKDFSLFLTKNKFPKGKLPASFLKQIYVLNKQDMLYVTAAGKGKKIFHYTKDSIVQEKEIFDLSLYPEYNNWAAYTGSFGVNIKKNRMVYAYKYFRQIKFLSVNGKKEHQLILKQKKTKAGNARAMLAPTNITYYWKMSTTKEHVYVSYSGRTPIEVVRDEKKGKDYIHIEEFDWNGNPKRKFKLDKWGYFCVDEKRNKLYLIATNAEEPFYVYDLPNK